MLKQQKKHKYYLTIGASAFVLAMAMPLHISSAQTQTDGEAASLTLPLTQAEAESVVERIRNGETIEFTGDVHSGDITHRSFGTREFFNFGRSGARMNEDQFINALMTGQYQYEVDVPPCWMDGDGENSGHRSQRSTRDCMTEIRTASFQLAGDVAPPTANNTATTNGLTYVRSAMLDGWQDANLLIPNDYAGQWVQQAPMECVFQERREVGDCSGEIQRRTWTATAPGQTPDFGSWVTIGSYDRCPPPPSSSGGDSGGGGGDNDRDNHSPDNFDVDGDGDRLEDERDARRDARN